MRNSSEAIRLRCSETKKLSRLWSIDGLKGAGVRMAGGRRLLPGAD